MTPKKIILKGGRSAHSVVRIGHEVHRTKSSNHLFIHSLLSHLEKKEFFEAPKFIRLNADGEEVLTFIDGEVPFNVQLTLEQVVFCVQMLKRYHDAASSSDLCEGNETVCHNDFSPWNVIFKNGVPTGIIDFDDSAPGSRIDDLTYFLWTFLDLGNPNIPDEVQVLNIVRLCNDYGLDRREKFVDSLLRQQDRILQFRINKAQYAISEAERTFSQNAISRILSDKEWAKAKRTIIESALIVG